MSADGVKGAIGICVLVGALSVLGGLVALAGVLDGFAGPEFQPTVFGWLALGEGLVYLGLAYGMRRGSAVCGFVAAGLYTVTTASMLTTFGPGGVLIRLGFMAVLWKGAFQIQAFQAVAASPPEAPAPRRTGRAPWSSASAPTGVKRRLDAPARRPRTRRYREPRSMCPNCRESFPAHQERCSVCAVMLVEV